MTTITREGEIAWLKDTISEYKQHIKECQAYLDACNSRLDELTRLDELNGENHDWRKISHAFVPSYAWARRVHSVQPGSQQRQARSQAYPFTLCQWMEIGIV